MKVKLHGFETVQALLLFGVSTWFTCERFAELAGSGLKVVLPFILLGVGFELTRVSLWVRYCLEKVVMYKWVALFLTILSIVASLSKITANLEAVSTAGESQKRAAQVQETIVQGYDEQIKILLERLRETPKDFVTAARKLQEQIDVLMVKRNEALIKGSEAVEVAAKEAVSAKKRDMFDVLGAVFGLREALVKLLRIIFLGLVTIGSEVGLLISSKAAVERKEAVVEKREEETYSGNVPVAEVRLSVLEVLSQSKRKGARPVPSLETFLRSGVEISKEAYQSMVARFIRRGLVYRRGGRAWFGAEITSEDIREVLDEKA